MDFFQFLRTVFKYIPLLILLPLVSMIITFILVQSSDSEYRARAVLSSGFIESQNTPGNDGRISRDQITFQYANLMELLSSKNVYDFTSYALLRHDMKNTDQAFRTFGESYAEFSDELKSDIVDTLDYALDEFHHLDETEGIGAHILELLEEMEYDYESLQKQITIRRMGQSDYIHVIAETESSKLSAFIANNFAGRFINYYKISQNRLLSVNIQFYLDQVELRENQLEERTERLQNFKVRNSITNITEQTKSLAVQIADFERVREREISAYRGAKSLIDSLNVVLQEGGDGYTEGRASALNTQIAIARRSIAELNRRRINAQARGNRELMAELEEQISEERERMKEALLVTNNQAMVDPRMARQQLLSERLMLAVEAENARQSLNFIETELDRLEDKTREFARMEAVLDTYTRDIDLAEREYLSMRDRLNQFRLEQQSMSSGAQMEQVQSALPPTDPLPSKKLIILLVAGAGSFAFTLVAIFAIEYLDNTIRNARNLANRTGEPVIGVLPRLTSEEIDIPAIFDPDHIPRHSLERITGLMVRMLRYNLLKQMKGKKLLISSSHPGAGKTFLSVFLAYALAESKYRVLLVDASPRNPSLTSQFEAEPVLESYLSGRIDYQQAALQTDHPNIKLIGCARGGKTIYEMASQAEIRQALERAESYCDIMIIDASPMVKENNARELLPFSDTALMIYSAIDVLDTVDIRVVSELNDASVSYAGGVVNKVETEEMEQEYGEIEKDRSFIRRFAKNLIRGKLKGIFERNKKEKVKTEESGEDKPET